jgi:uncharacterized protein (TIRG00374 family)
VNNKLKQILKSVLFVGTGVGILSWVYIKFDRQYTENCLSQGSEIGDCSLLDKLWADFLSVNPFWLGLACLAFLLSNVSRAVRWRALLLPLGYKVSHRIAFWSIMLGYFANLGFPRIGEVIRGGSLSRYERVPLEKSMGTIVADRVIDLFSFGIMFLLALLFEYEILKTQLEKHVWTQLESLGNSSGLWITIIVFSLLFVILYRIRQKLYGLGFVLKIKEVIKGFVSGLQSVRQVQQKGLFLFHSIAIWILYYLMTYFTFLSFGPTADLGLSTALLVFVFGSLGMIIPSPGGMGTYQGLVALAVSFFGVSLADGFSYANINFFSIQIFCNVFFGLLALFILPWIQRYRNAEGAAEDS